MIALWLLLMETTNKFKVTCIKHHNTTTLGRHCCYVTNSGDWIYMYLVDFPPFCTRKTTSVASCLLACAQDLFRKGIYSQRKEFAPKRGLFSKEFATKESKFFLLIYSQRKEFASERDLLSKKRICSKREQILSFESRPFFKMGQNYFNKIFSRRGTNY